MTRRILVAVLAVGVSCCLFIAHLRGSSDPVFSQIDAIVKSISDISGLSEMHAVPYGRMSKRQLRQFLNKRIKRTLRPEEIYADELALKMFGFVPQDFDLRKSTVELLTEQAAAFYDYDLKKLFLLREASVDTETITLAHELSHALADQHFNLSKFMDDTPSNDDENLAHSAVVEGQASWLMIAYTLREAGQEPIPTPEMLQSVVGSSRASLAEYPVLKDSPLYIQQSLLFPYTQGTNFFDTVYRRMGKQAFTAVFANPPSDSGQVLHPERYLGHEQATRPELPSLGLGNDSEEITQGSLGEFDHSILLRQFVSEEQAELLAPHVKGGKFRIVTDGSSHRPLLEFSSEWDSPAHAAAFFALYRRVLAGKWRRCDFIRANEAMLEGSSDHGFFLCRLVGSVMQSVEGIGDTAEWQRLKLSLDAAATLH